MPAEGRTRLGKRILHKPARHIHGCDCKVDSSNHSWKRSAFFDPMAHGIDSRTKEKEAGKEAGKRRKQRKEERRREKEKKHEIIELMQVEMNRNLFYMDTTRLFKV